MSSDEVLIENDMVTTRKNARTIILGEFRFAGVNLRYGNRKHQASFLLFLEQLVLVDSSAVCRQLLFLLAAFLLVF